MVPAHPVRQSHRFFHTFFALGTTGYDRGHGRGATVDVPAIGQPGFLDVRQSAKSETQRVMCGGARRTHAGTTPRGNTSAGKTQTIETAHVTAALSLITYIRLSRQP